MLPRVRSVFRWCTAVLVVAILAQIGFAGYGAFNAIHKAANAPITKKAIENGFDIHGALGTLIVVAMLVLLIVAATGRVGATKLKWSAVLAVLGIVQYVLGAASTSVPVLGFLHALNALVILGIAAYLVHQTWTRTEDRASAAPAASAGA